MKNLVFVFVRLKLLLTKEITWKLIVHLFKWKFQPWTVGLSSSCTKLTFRGVISRSGWQFCLVTFGPLVINLFLIRFTVIWLPDSNPNKGARDPTAMRQKKATAEGWDKNDHIQKCIENVLVPYAVLFWLYCQERSLSAAKENFFRSA